MYSNEVKGAPQNPDLLLRSYMVGRVLLRPSPPTIQHIYTYQIKKSVQPTGYDALHCVKAFQLAVSRYDVPEKFNSDPGSQFTSREFTDEQKMLGFAICAWTDAADAGTMPGWNGSGGR